MRAILRHARLSPKKINLVASMIRNMPVTDALVALEHMPKKGAKILHDVVSSAVANAENNVSQRRDSLFIKNLVVNKGPAFRRFIPIARGRARPIDKWTSHITVELGIVVPEGEKKVAKIEKVAKVAKTDKKKTEKKLIADDVEGPIGQAPGNPEKQTGQSEDTHASGSQNKQTGGTFTQHRQGARGE